MVRPLQDRAALDAALEAQYGVPPGSLDHLAFYESSGGKVYAATIRVRPNDIRARVARVGLYFAKWEEGRGPDGGPGLRVSMDGAWLIHTAAGRVLDVDEAAARHWLSGGSLPAEGAGDGYIVLRWDGHALGVGEVEGGYVHNRVPKMRRIPAAGE